MPIGRALLKITALLPALTLLALLAILAPTALGQTSTWNAGTGDWSLPGNWTGGVPTNMSNVVIGPSSGPFSFGSPTLDVDATVNTLNLGMQASLTFGFASSLTVNSTATLVGNTNVDLSPLTLNGASENFGTINLSTETITFNGHTFLIGEGSLNGAGTLGNAGTIQGAGNIRIDINNLGIIQATDPNHPLILSGSVNNSNVIEGIGGTVALNGGTVTGGILEGSFSSNGGTIGFAQLGAPITITSPGDQFFLAAGSMLSLKGTVENFGGVELGNGSTVNGGGTATLVTSGFLNGTVPVIGSGATLAATNINNANGTLIGGGPALTLNGVSLTGGTLEGQFTTLNGTTISNAQLGMAVGFSFGLTDGSTLAIQGTVTTGDTVTLGNATLTGNGTGKLSDFTTITGNGTTLANLTLNNVGTLTATGAGITLNGVTVNGGGLPGSGVLDGLFTPINGTIIANSQLGSAGNSFQVPDGSTVAIRGFTTVGSVLSLGSGTTFNGGGVTTLFNNGNPITGNGGTLIGMNIVNSGGATLNGTGAGLTLNNVGVTGGFIFGQFTTLNGTTIGNATLDSLNLTAGSTLALEGTVTQQGQITNAGTLLIDKGATLNNVFTAPYVQTAGQTIVDGTIEVGSPAVQLKGGVLSGTGGVFGGLLNVGGTVEPGDGGAPGTLFVSSYEQQSGAIFDELIGSSGNGLITEASNITLDPGALLNIDLLNGFTPTDGEMFTIMTSLEFLGTFANAPTAGFQMDGFNWKISYNPFDIVLDAVSPVGCSGAGCTNGGGGNNTPEPASLGLLLAGLSALALWHMRKEND